MDDIAKLREVSTRAFVQRNQFPNHGDEANKVVVFKMSEVNPGSRVNLVRCMQQGKNLKHAWIVSNHVTYTTWRTIKTKVMD